MNPGTHDDAPDSQPNPATLLDASGPTPICWAVLDDATASRELNAWTEWVHWLATQYILTPRTIPPCWHQHPALVEALLALRTAWLAAFAPNARPDAPLDWHIMFWPACDRLAEIVSWAGCTRDDHHEDGPATWLAVADRDSDSAVGEHGADRRRQP